MKREFEKEPGALKGNHKRSFIGVNLVFPAEHQQVLRFAFSPRHGKMLGHISCGGCPSAPQCTPLPIEMVFLLRPPMKQEKPKEAKPQENRVGSPNYNQAVGWFAESHGAIHRPFSRGQFFSGTEEALGGCGGALQPAHAVA